MRATVATIALTAALAVGALASVTVAGAQDDDEPEAGGATPEALIDRLVELERELPPLPPDDVVLDDETTWGEIQGDFFSARTDLELLEDRARQLFVDADDADGATAEAVAAVARGYLELQQGYRYLADYEGYDLALPVNETDTDDVATGADDAAGLAETGLSLVITARVRAIEGYDVLRDDSAADDTEKSLFDASFQATETFLEETRPQLHELLSRPTVGLLVVIDRFDPPPGIAHAKDMTVVCLDRDRYPSEAESLEDALVQLLSEGLEPTDAIDCPDLPSDSDVTVSSG